MKLYLVERTDDYGYDDYDSLVCWANSEEEARHVSPSKFYEWRDPEGWYFIYADGTSKPENRYDWPNDPKTLKVWELSRAPEKPVLVLSSFNAG